MSDLSDLIERLEAADGPCRKLDARILCAKGWTESKLDWFTPPNLPVLYHKAELPRPTASIDAALTLVPEGLLWTVSQQDNLAAVSIFRRNEEGERETCCGLTVAKTPALAICIAALKALEGTDSE